MLKLKPNCEWCDKDLPPSSTDAMICTYECTFCKNCVESVLENVCPNCGGGFCQRPARPAKAYREGVSLVHQPNSTDRVHASYTLEEINTFSRTLKDIPPDLR